MIKQYYDCIFDNGDYFCRRFIERTLPRDIREYQRYWQHKGKPAPPSQLWSLKWEYLDLCKKAMSFPEMFTEAALVSLHKKIINSLGYSCDSAEHLFAHTKNLVKRCSLKQLEKNWLEIFTTDYYSCDSLLPPPWSDSINEYFRQSESPRWLMIITGGAILLLDKFTFSENRYIVIDLDKAWKTDKHCAFEPVCALLVREQLCPVGTLHAQNGSHTARFSPDTPAKNSPIKVALVVGSINPGGVAITTIALGTGLARLGYEITIVTTCRPGLWASEIEKNKLQALHICGRDSTHEYAYAWKVGKTLKEKQFQVIIVVKYGSGEPFTQAVLQRFPNNVIIIPWLNSDTMDMYQALMLNQSAWNVAVAAAPRVAARALRLTFGKALEIIPNGFDFNHAASCHAHHTRRPDERPFRLCFIGRLYRDKGIITAVNILHRCRQKGLDIVLEIAGDGEDRQEMQQKISALKLNSYVVLHGMIDNSAAMELMRRSHVLVLPTLFESFANVPVEAQFCGCVPIVSNIPGVTDNNLDHGRTGFLADALDVNSFVERIEYLYRNPEKWREFSQNGPAKAADFSLQQINTRFDKLIQRSLSGEYPLERPRKKWLLVHPAAFSWKAVLPFWMRKSKVALSVRSTLRKILDKTHISR